METINMRVKQVRSDWEMNQIDFAKRLGVTNAHISAIEKGKTTPSQALVKLICKEFKVNERWLTTGEGPIDEHDFETDVDSKMITATQKMSKLLKTDGIVRAMAAELNLQFANMLTLDLKGEERLVEYLGISHNILYHLNTYLDFQKKTAEQHQLHLFPYPDDLIANLKNDIEKYERFFRSLSDE